MAINAIKLSGPFLMVRVYVAIQRHNTDSSCRRARAALQPLATVMLAIIVLHYFVKSIDLRVNAPMEMF